MTENERWAEVDIQLAKRTEKIRELSKELQARGMKLVQHRAEPHLVLKELQNRIHVITTEQVEPDLDEAGDIKVWSSTFFELTQDEINALPQGVEPGPAQFKDVPPNASSLTDVYMTGTRINDTDPEYQAGLVKGVGEDYVYSPSYYKEGAEIITFIR